MDGNFNEDSTKQESQSQYQYTYDIQPSAPATPVNTYTQDNSVEMEEPVKMSEWILILALCSFVPCVGLILVIVFAFSKNEKKSKQTFCKAYLIIALIKLIIGIIIAIAYGALIYALITA